jgi:hypothetical protein
MLAYDPMDMIDTVKPTEPIERTEPSEQIDSAESRTCMTIATSPSMTSDQRRTWQHVIT